MKKTTALRVMLKIIIIMLKMFAIKMAPMILKKRRRPKRPRKKNEPRKRPDGKR